MRHLRSYSIVSFLILILIGQTCGVFGQTIPLANHVVINEADTNPSGDDAKYPIDWVELYNPTNSPVNIGGWTVGATTGLRQTYTIPANTMIPSKQFLVYTYGPLWFPHAGAVIQLKSSDGTVIDQTPPLTDFQGDANSWQRIYDGYNTGSASDWVFKLGTPGSSNGQPPTTTTTSSTTMTFAIDKPSYIFGDTVMMSGKVSKLTVDPVLGYPLSVNLVVSGPSGFQKTFTLYPSTNLQFSTSMKIDKVLGFSEGNYTISASYGNATSSATFVLGSTAFTPPPQIAPIIMSISTDKPTYTVSDTITLAGTVSQVIPLTPVSYKVYDPNGTMIYQGNLFPDSQGKFSTYNPYQQHASASGVFINTINPLYGIYNIVASYGTVIARTSFGFIPQVQTAGITLSTDKQAYAPGDKVTISGHASLQGLKNVGLAPSLQIIQTLQTSSSGTNQIGNRGIVPNTINVRTFINISPDGTFSYLLNLPGSSASLGNYRAIVTAAVGSAEADFVVITNPSTYHATSSAPLSITTDKTLYAIGDKIIISGLVLNPQSHTTTGGTSVSVVVTNSTGNPVLSQQNPHANIFTSVSVAPTQLTYYAYPDSNGAYQLTQTIQRGVYQPGNYTLKATYNSIQASVSFSVYDPLSTGSQGPIVANTDKQLYGIGETVHLTGKISALIGTSSSNTVTLIKPTGDLVTSTLQVNNGVFSWDWTIPTSAVPTFSSIGGGYRGSVTNVSTTLNLYGIYSIIIHSDFGSKQIFFQVLQNPQSQSQISPIVVETDKSEYSTTDVMSISGQILPQANAAAQEQNTQAQILVYSGTGQEVYRNFPNVNAGGQFHLAVPLHPGLWPTGTYKIYAQYLTTGTQTTFHVTDSFTTGNYTKQVFITTDRDKYLPGQTVLVTGRTSFIMALPTTYLTFGGLANDTIISEGQIVSQHGYTLHRITVPFDQYTSFSYDYAIPKGTPLGNYTVVAEVPFGFFNAYYQVVNQLPSENVPTPSNVTQIIPPPANVTQTPVEPTIIPTSIGPTQKTVPSTMIIDKQGMLTGSTIPITISEKTLGNNTYSPREIDGLLRINPNDVNAVTLKLSLQDGTCIIGSDSSCKVSQSTIKSGSLYQIVKLGNENFLVGFSGSGQRLQQFSVMPLNANDVIPDGKWNVDIMKKDQISRFYYQVTYISK